MVKTAAILRSRAFLAIASGYLFAACIVIPWMLTFPGVFTPGGLPGAGLQSTNSLYLQWHAGFPGFVIVYALLKDTDRAKRLWRGSVGAAILSSVATTAVIVCVATLLATAGDALLPQLVLDAVRLSGRGVYVGGCLPLWSVLALIVLCIISTASSNRRQRPAGLSRSAHCRSFSFRGRTCPGPGDIRPGSFRPR
jgi:hypothetical protein